MSRELRTRARARIQPDTDDESSESEADDDVPAQIPSTSIQDLINPADAGQFDQTFSDADANLNIEGAFDPVAGDKQVIPRVAYVLNFNLLYNEAQERWEPQRSGDTGNSTGGIGSSIALSSGFGTFFTPLPNSSGFLQIYTRADTDGNENGNIRLAVDESGGTTADYTYRLAFANEDEPSKTSAFEDTLQPLPAGASAEIRNIDDPTGLNEIRLLRAYPLE
jgi:hypothetical protein